MKFIFIDESGKASDNKHAVLCGFSCDHARMKKTRRKWIKFIAWLKDQGVQVSEMHTAKFFKGGGKWSKLDASTRKQITAAIVKYIQDRAHEFCIVALDKEKFKEQKEGSDLLIHQNEWFFLSTHLVFAFSKRYQNEKASKGDFVAIFDNSCIGSDFCEYILSVDAEEMFKEYSGFKKGEIKLSDTPFSADSKYSSIVQISDFIVFFARRYIEISEGEVEKYKGEKEDVFSIYEALRERHLDTRFTYKKSKRSEIEEVFFEVAPDCLKK